MILKLLQSYEEKLETYLKDRLNPLDDTLKGIVRHAWINGFYSAKKLAWQELNAAFQANDKFVHTYRLENLGETDGENSESNSG